VLAQVDLGAGLGRHDDPEHEQVSRFVPRLRRLREVDVMAAGVKAKPFGTLLLRAFPSEVAPVRRPRGRLGVA
jgi:hypothetical protein